MFSEGHRHATVFSRRIQPLTHARTHARDPQNPFLRDNSRAAVKSSCPLIAAGRSNLTRDTKTCSLGLRGRANLAARLSRRARRGRETRRGDKQMAVLLSAHLRQVQRLSSLLCAPFGRTEVRAAGNRSSNSAASSKPQHCRYCTVLVFPRATGSSNLGSSFPSHMASGRPFFNMLPV
ncbi:hypothetical protein AOLI_G00025630 [Acnodon oligacanthus]